jgi:uncharacterized protein (TIGR02145 family)
MHKLNILRRITLPIVAVLFSSMTFAQAPNKMSYQAVIRNSSNALVSNQPVGMRISILQGTANGTAVYVETQTPTTNANGLASLEVGGGTVVSGNFSTIDWANGPYFLKTETDVNGGTNYSITGTSQLLSVPYALFSANGILSVSATGDTLYLANGAHLIIPGISAANTSDGGTGPYPVGSVFCNGPTAVVDVTNPATGKIWMDRNLGAAQVATSSTDANAYGDLYQWGRGSDGHQCRNSSTTSTLSISDQPGNADFILAPNSPYDWRNPQNTNLWQGVNGVNNPCPTGYRVPTDAELDAERISWSSNNAAGAFASPLKLPVAGYRGNSTGSLVNVGTNGIYWSSTVSGTQARDLDFLSNFANMYNIFRAFGVSLRCIKD